MNNKQQAIKFSCIQVSKLLDVLEKFGIEPNMSDAHASAMFSELMVTGAKELDPDQVNDFWDAV